MKNQNQNITYKIYWKHNPVSRPEVWAKQQGNRRLVAVPLNDAEKLVKAGKITDKDLLEFLAKRKPRITKSKDNLKQGRICPKLSTMMGIKPLFLQ